MTKTGNDNDEISKRIDKIRQYFCDGVNIDFAAKIGKDPTYTSQLCNGTKSIGKKIIEKILETFPEVSRTWLYFGEGNMMARKIRPYSATEDNTPSVVAEESSSPYGHPVVHEDSRTIFNLNNHIELLQEQIAMLKRELEQERAKTRRYSETPTEQNL